MLVRTAEHDRQIAANARTRPPESLEVEEYQHFLSAQLTDGSMDSFMVRKRCVRDSGL